MQLVIIFTLMNAPSIETFSLGKASSSAIGAAKKFLSGTRKAKSTIHQTPIENTLPGAVSVGKSEDGIMKKSVDFLANGALLVGGLGSIYNHFSEPTPVSIYHCNPLGNFQTSVSLTDLA